MRSTVLSLALWVMATSLTAADQVFPIINGKIGDRRFTTTVELRNRGTSTSRCVFEYRRPSQANHSVTSYLDVAPGPPLISEEFLSEIETASTIRVRCTSPVEVFSRLQESTDGGKNYGPGRLYKALTKTPLSAGEHETIPTRVDLLTAEVSGKPASIEVTAKNKGGVTFANRSYHLLPYGLRIIDLSAVLKDLQEPDVEVRVSGTGKVVVAREAGEPSLEKVAQRMTPETRARFEAHQVKMAAATMAAEELPKPSATRLLLMCPFKGAPFMEPATGLCFMRDRWYDPATGSFLTPDRMGYRDSSNPYLFGKGDPVNNSDPTGMYIDETAILNSPLKKAYTAWRDDFRSSRLGRKAWDRIHALPANRFTLRMNPLVASTGDTTGAIAERQYDAAGRYVGGSIAFGPRFGTTEPDPKRSTERSYVPTRVSSG